MDAIAVTSYRQLLDEIKKLPPPAEGTVRLFRGQTKDYSAILSSLGRTLRTRPAGEWFETRIKQLYIKAGLLSVVGDLLRLPQLGPIDILFNNAGMNIRKPFEDYTEEEFDRIISVHLKGMFFMAQAVYPSMVARGEGCIINVASQRGLKGAVNSAPYSAAALAGSSA